MRPSVQSLLRLIVCAVTLGPVAAWGQLDFESPPIDYVAEATADPVAQLQARLLAGTTTLKHDDRQGYLADLLKQLDIAPSSQTLVFSQTSFQLRKISPARPRAVYFNDDSYIGWVQFGDVVEISSVDPRQGAIFYTLEQMSSDKPRFVRDKGQCLTCHAASRTQGVPGHLMRSVFADRAGVPLLGSGTFTTDHASPLAERWGGWYVSGHHGAQRHMGNAVVVDRNAPEKIDRAAAANITDLGQLFRTEPYLTPHSDIVALLVLGHQLSMHNLITRASFETRLAEHQDGVMNEALQRPAEHRSETTQRRIASASDTLLKYLLFSGECPLTAAVVGTTSFADDFSRRGPQDRRGRSLRDFDLQSRLFRYPCSYLIYSSAFDSLPPPVLKHVYQRLARVLSGQDQSPEFSHLSSSDRTAIREILLDTKPAFAAVDSLVPSE